MKTRAGMALVLALGTAFAAGCGDGPTNPEEVSGVDAAMAEQFATAMTTSGSSTAAGAFSPPQGGNAPSEGTYTWDDTYACSVGEGELDADGQIDWTYDKPTKEATISITASLTHVDCGFPVGERTFTLNGDPSLDLTAELHTVNGKPEGEQTVSLAGGFTWTDDAEGSGSCQVDLTYTYEVDSATNTTTGTVSGTFCSHTIDRTIEATGG